MWVQISVSVGFLNHFLWSWVVETSPSAWCGMLKISEMCKHSGRALLKGFNGKRVELIQIVMSNSKIL